MQPGVCLPGGGGHLGEMSKNNRMHSLARSTRFLQDSEAGCFHYRNIFSIMTEYLDDFESLEDRFEYSG